MTAKRQDAWTPEDDMILAEVTLRHIREGGTQLSAFEEVAERLGRTPAACGFRWNSAVRKQYEPAIQVAKTQRQKRNKERMRVQTVFSEPITPAYSEEYMMPTGIEEDQTYSLDHIIRFLRQHKNEVHEMRRQQKQLEKELDERERECKRLERENYEMRMQLDHVENDYQSVNDDYRMLMQIMERARKKAWMEEPPSRKRSNTENQLSPTLEDSDS
ncbi:RsfA family transcriptional regulator [Risungbinella massiliensis]|uniref:RsfA family transcriptional regulator n=1 Tax=Risungbinella massiliensis TaxID=1329796 RepID=UPI0005CC5881|nr:RsfA family transcriptional regulator [Risungbinella massiliensis]